VVRRRYRCGAGAANTAGRAKNPSSEAIGHQLRVERPGAPGVARPGDNDSDVVRGHAIRGEGALIRRISRATGSGWHRPAAIAVCVLLVGALLAACGDRSTSSAAGTFVPRTPGILTVVTSAVPTPGFWVGTASHPTGGLEYELAKDLADRFGLKSVRIELEHFHRIVGGDLGHADLALDLITPTADRRQSLDFSAPYLDAAPTVVVRDGTDVPDLDTAQGLRWGAVRATTFVGIIGSLISPDEPVRMFDNSPEMLAALENSQIDAVLLDMPLAVVTARRSAGRLQAAAQLPVTESIAAALPKGSSNLQAVNSSMRAFTADGTIDHLLQVWVGSDAANAESSIPLLHTTR
jgi:polar amino acid transport system substrate-binding protein